MALPVVPPGILQRIAEAITGMRYGQVQITIHDARVVQIDKIEKIRLADQASGSPAPLPREAAGPRRPA